MIGIAKRRVLLTRATEDNAAWADELRARGAEPVELPCIATEPLPVDRAALRAGLERATWLVLPSRRAVQLFADAGGTPLPDDLLVACVGPATARAARERLGRANLTPAVATLRGLAETLATHRPRRGTRVLLAAAQEGRRDLEELLVPRGYVVDRVALYRTLPARTADARVPWSELRVDAAVLASPSAVRGFVAQVDADPASALVTLGPTTSAAVQEAGLAVAAEAETRDIGGIVSALERAVLTAPYSTTSNEETS
jgi:uroporphyrinogen-III synthase